MGFNLNFSYGKAPNYVERDSSGNFFYSFLDNLFGVEKKIEDTTKYTFQNPRKLDLHGMALPKLFYFMARTLFLIFKPKHFLHSIYM